METNPYAAPGAVVEDAPAFGGDLESRKASRGQRLGAALLDGLAILICLAPVSFEAYAGYMARARGQAAPVFTASGAMVVCTLLALGLIVYNMVLLHRNGQTIGKKILGIKVVRSDGSPVALSRIIFLRWLPIAIAGRIPLIGPLIGLANPLVIFGNEKRCIHDYIADTIVITD